MLEELEELDIKLTLKPKLKQKFPDIFLPLLCYPLPLKEKNLITILELKSKDLHMDLNLLSCPKMPSSLTNMEDKNTKSYGTPSIPLLDMLMIANFPKWTIMNSV